MSDRYNTYGQSFDDEFDEYDEYIRRNASRRASSSSSARQQFAASEQQAGYRQDQGRSAQGSYSRTRSQQPASRTGVSTGRSSRERFSSQQQYQAQGQRPQTRHYSSDEYGYSPRAQRSERPQQAQESRASASRRRVTLDQSSRVRRNEVASPAQFEPQEETGGILSRFQQDNYHARPGFQMPEVSMPSGNLSYIIRIGLIVVLLLVFGIRLALNGPTSSQLAEPQSTVAEQQATLDELKTTNAELQEAIDSHASTIETYNALKG